MKEAAGEGPAPGSAEPQLGENPLGRGEPRPLVHNFSGIGRATALVFALQGGTVVICARDQKPLDDTVAECKRAGGRPLAVAAGVTREKLRVVPGAAHALD